MDYWRGFTGGFVAGVAIGALLYLSPKISGETAGPDGPLFLRRESPESAGDPAQLLPETAGVSKMEFERQGQSAD
jgi:hypothetical protein